MPEAYEGNSIRLQQNVDELIYLEESFYTTALAPYVFTDQISVSWDKWTFNQHFTGVVPEQGVSRLVSSRRETRQESFVRRGLGLILEHGFMASPGGREHYFLSLAQVCFIVFNVCAHLFKTPVYFRLRAPWLRPSTLVSFTRI